MVGVVRRMNKLKAQLLSIRHGPGAAVLPTGITRIHMEFALRWNDGHYGPRKFWQDCLPRLKYWNPAVPMIVNRTSDNAGPATMTIYLQKDPGSAAPTPQITADVQPSSSFIAQSKAPEPTPAERTVHINLKGLHSDAILKAVLAETHAVPIKPTAQEEAEIQDVRDRVERAKVDREVMLKYLTAQRREAALLAQAKSEVEAMKLTA